MRGIVNQGGTVIERDLIGVGQHTDCLVGSICAHRVSEQFTEAIREGKIAVPQPAVTVDKAIDIGGTLGQRDQPRFRIHVGSDGGLVGITHIQLFLTRRA